MESFNQHNFAHSFSNSTSPSESTFDSHINSRPSLIVQQTRLPAATRTSPEKKPRKPRGKKLFSDERCAICQRKAQGIKYNAISCDSCRVFFRRIVLLQNHETYSNLTCQREIIQSRASHLSNHEIMLKCQHCRFEACLKAGMRPEYVQGTRSFNDKRTCRKTNTEAAEESTSETSPIQSIDASPHDCTLMELVRTFWNDYTGNRHLRNGSVASITAEKNTTSMTRWEPPTSSWAKLRCVDHIRDSLNMHVEVLVDFISVLPYIANNFDASQRKTLVTKSFMELIILRWTKTTKPTSGVITGVTGHNYSMKDMSKFGSDWQQKFADYYATAMKIKALGGDDLDHALIAALIVFSSDRNDWLTMEQRHVIHFLQEIFIKALMNKAKSEGKKRKFFQLFNSILSLREVVNEADVNQVYRYNRRILPNDNFTGDKDSDSSPDQSPRNFDGANSSSRRQYSALPSRPLDPRMLHMR